MKDGIADGSKLTSHGVPLKKIAQTTGIARAAAFLASHRAAGHISGQRISVEGGMEVRIVWSKDEIQMSQQTASDNTIPAPENKRRLKIRFLRWANGRSSTLGAIQEAWSTR
ncbi:hypothetical protein BDU57DRAFT_70521 [Ampelomyces quisqualis]|uniref:Uncharacterized protein n=1 Tax=Ampelomyces quisqualis TaxID=50730 RepID=A0A6A5R4G6_AMPQU|nr:hypothetical protein BDU57DRAFT_70521 [Ampelomyces quisqualis]